MLKGTKETPVEFTGKAGEYFGIWIVNLLLSIITLGIYSAWAKVRRKKYFYQNTLIDGVGFDYHASPIAILKGRIIAFVFFMAYIFSQHISPFLPTVFAFIILFLMPWLVIRTMTFNARNSSYRGLRFDFNGDMREAAIVFIGLPILIIFTLGLIVPYMVMRQSRYLIQNHKFGLTAFSMDAQAKDFYLIYGKALLLLLGIGAALSVAVTLTVDQNFLLNAVNDMRTVETFANFGIIIAAFFLFYFLIILGIGAYIQSRISNLVWNSTTLGNLSFHSHLRARDMLWLYLSNLLIIICSFGLLTPLAHVRMMRYRASRLNLTGETDFDRFIGDKKADVKATGAEMAEMFDLDITFG
ncbi:MAG: YjgN family protein [Methylobacter sp.]|uniref:YjgN family protein n=1 Tax=Methylobacter sp. TaxID=2051955 RepID=UPI00258CE91C|nr:YjgN family protein [Methylobacter sp.]MCL7422249.1 YjgN family protein [Methylobacter sp.]